MIFTMIYMLPLLGSLLVGLALLVTGAILLLKVENKIAGVLAIAVGLVFTLCPLAVFLYFLINARIYG
jgi:hypothetical protein